MPEGKWIGLRKQLAGEAETAAKQVEATHAVLVKDRTMANHNAYRAALDYQISVDTVRIELAWW